MANDWLAKKDDDFDKQLKKFHDWINDLSNLPKAGLTAPDLADFNAKEYNWTLTYGPLLAYLEGAKPMVTAKQTARTEVTPPLRALAELLRSRRKLGFLTDADLVAAGVPPADGTPSAAPVPATWPVITIEAGVIFKHTYNWRDSGTPGSKAKPAGVKHAELRFTVLPIGTAAPVDPMDFPGQIIDPATPNPHEFDPADGGKEVTIAGRWVSTAGDEGPWGPAVSALVQM